MRRSWVVFGFTALFVIGGALVYRPSAQGDMPRLPTDDREVLERVPARQLNPRARRRSELRATLAARPNDLRVATELARLDIEESRARSDPRYLGYAQAALGPWWESETPPTDVLVLRATIRQSQHDFEGALVDLDRVIVIAPTDIQSWLTRAVVLTVLGRYADARVSCKPLESLAPAIVSAVCVAAIDGVNGAASAAYDRLSSALTTDPNIPAETREWALSTLGEIALRAGRDSDAERILRQALAIDAEDPYVIAALADLFLDTHRPRDAASLVEKYTDNDGLLLRLALAEKSARLPNAAVHADLLASRYDASRLRGDVVHRREQARFELGVRGNAKDALALAVANWNVQHEPWDARIVLEGAVATNDSGAAQPVIAFVRDNHLEDPRIALLVAEIAKRMH